MDFSFYSADEKRVKGAACYVPRIFVHVKTSMCLTPVAHGVGVVRRLACSQPRAGDAAMRRCGDAACSVTGPYV